jgi:hypothetical protein
MRVSVFAVLAGAILVAGCAEPQAAKVDVAPPALAARPNSSAVMASPPPPLVNEPTLTPRPRSMTDNWDPPGGITHKWRYIVIHHTASDVGSLGKIDQWHKSKGWDGCGYHFVIGNGTNSSDGLIQVSQRWLDQGVGAHTRLADGFARDRGLAANYYNECGIGIVLVGNFDNGPPDARQMASLAKLLNYLMDRCQIPESHVVTHGGVDQTHCPGHYFSRTQALLMARTMKAFAAAK